MMAFIKVIIYLSAWGVAALFFSVKQYEISIFIGGVLLLILILSIRFISVGEPVKALKTSGVARRESTHDSADDTLYHVATPGTRPASTEGKYVERVWPADSETDDEFVARRIKELDAEVDEIASWHGGITSIGNLPPTKGSKGPTKATPPVDPPGPSDDDTDQLLDDWSKGKLR